MAAGQVAAGRELGVRERLERDAEALLCVRVHFFEGAYSAAAEPPPPRSFLSLVNFFDSSHSSHPHHTTFIVFL